MKKSFLNNTYEDIFNIVFKINIPNEGLNRSVYATNINSKKADKILLDFKA